MGLAVRIVFWLSALTVFAGMRMLPLAQWLALPLAWFTGLIVGLAATIGFVSLPYVATRYTAEESVRVENLIGGWIGFGIFTLLTATLWLMIRR